MQTSKPNLLKSLQALKPKTAPDELLKYHLHKALAKASPARSHNRVHASDLTKEDYEFCPREFALLSEAKKNRPDEFLTTALQVTFQIGRDVQEYVVDTFAAIDQAVGNWVCEVCHTTHEFQKKPKVCSAKCKCTVFKQEEFRFQSDVTGASCGIDMLWNKGDPAHTIVEIKSIDKDKFKELKAPLAEHRLRTNYYMRIVAESADERKNRVRQDQAKIIYVSKGGYGCEDLDVLKWGLGDGKFSPFKEFTVMRNDKETDFISEKALKFKKYKDGLGVPVGICTNSYGKRAMKCTCIKECFSGKFPASQQGE